MAAKADDRQMPLQALWGYRAIVGQEATPEVVGYDRGGDATATRQPRALEGGKEVGMPPTGKRPGSVAEGVREQMRRERGRTEGRIGMLQSNRSQCNTPKDRLWHPLEMAGPRSLLSGTLHKCMRDLVALTQ